MTIKCLHTGSDGNCYILTSDKGKHLILDAGIPIADIKKGFNFDIENVEGCIVTHKHLDHALSVDKLRIMGIPMFLPYKYPEHKRMKTHLGDFEISSFDVPHNETECRGFLIRIDRQTICYLTDLEYCPYDLSEQGINILMVECNYIKEMVSDDIPNLVHKVMGHCELETTIGIINNCKKNLRKVILVHMNKGETFNQEVAMERIKASIPKYIEVEFARAGTTYSLDEIPF